jgi:hypothetical protein
MLPTPKYAPDPLQRQKLASDPQPESVKESQSL